MCAHAVMIFNDEIPNLHLITPAQYYTMCFCRSNTKFDPKHHRFEYVIHNYKNTQPIGNLFTFEGWFLSFKMIVNMPGYRKRMVAVPTVKIPKYSDFVWQFCAVMSPELINNTHSRFVSSTLTINFQFTQHYVCTKNDNLKCIAYGT